MADYDYASLLNTGDRLIARFGDAARIVFYEDIPNETEPWEPPTRNTVIQNVKAVFVRATEKHADGKLIHIGDQLALVSGKCPRDLVNIIGTMERGAETWKIDRVVPIKPGPTVVLYKIRLVQ